MAPADQLLLYNGEWYSEKQVFEQTPETSMERPVVLFSEKSPWSDSPPRFDEGEYFLFNSEFICLILTERMHMFNNLLIDISDRNGLWFALI